MRFLATLCLSAVAVLSTAQPSAGVDLLGGDAGVVLDYPPTLRYLQESNETDAPVPPPPTETPPPPPTTAPPTPPPDTPFPTTTAPPFTETPAPSWTEAPTPTPAAFTPAPEGTTAPPWAATTAPPFTQPPTTPPTATEPPVASLSSSASGEDGQSSGSAASADSASAASADTSAGMSKGAVIGIVVGIVVAVALVAIAVMMVIRRRRDTDEDPLSPFELSMDKGYSTTPGFAPQESYNPRADAAAAAARDQRLESGSAGFATPGTAAAGAAAAGVAYSEFYDQQTSPDHAAAAPNAYQAQLTTLSSADSYATGAAGGNTRSTNDTNLWMSAMEPKENDSYLSAHESAAGERDDSRSERSRLSSRNSYDAPGPNDASSEISGASDLNSAKDFPDYDEQHSSRGSYEL